eukprot:Unigene489_Nuclearia_a/m.1580 Unigene489_Nuclearia_a/g.1580  ORF Unigene489_Nuclearia_a/g.1580 Unigene489_Nuclearia_a/m.1580 type:complete len:129 (-) Unigene489_Nuclearia_a:16-402(-)
MADVAAAVAPQVVAKIGQTVQGALAFAVAANGVDITRDGLKVAEIDACNGCCSCGHAAAMGWPCSCGHGVALPPYSQRASAAATTLGPTRPEIIVPTATKPDARYAVLQPIAKSLSEDLRTASTSARA